MTDGLSAHPLSSLLQELAEGLQSTGNYLAAARKHNGSSHAPIVEILDRAVVEMIRTQSSFHRLREHLILQQRCDGDATGVATMGEITSLIDADR